MFWITHPSYSILPSWFDDCTGKQKTNLALLITSYHNESAMPDFAYLRPKNLLKLVFPWIYMLCARYHYRITDIWQLIQVSILYNLYYLLVPSTVTSLNTIFFFSSWLPPLSFQLWMQVSLFVCSPWQLWVQRRCFVAIKTSCKAKQSICRLHHLLQKSS